MTDNLSEEKRVKRDYYDEEEISLLDYWRVIWKWKFFIIPFVLITILITAIISLSQTDIYQAAVVIAPIGGEQSGSSLSILSQQLGGIPGISLPPSTSTSEIINLLKSNIIREKMIERYNLLPILFYEQWDKEKKEWRRENKEGFSLYPSGLMYKIVEGVKPNRKVSNPTLNSKDKGIPTVWDGIRMLDTFVNIKDNVTDNTITISAECHDPEMAVKIVNYLLSTLTDHMSSEAKKIADTKRAYLEEQLRATADPLIRQKIYNLISQQIETSMMSALKEDFAFKVIDPARVPDRKIKPDRPRIVKMSFVASLFVGIFLAFFLEYISKKLKEG